MGRPREYERECVLDAALEVFLRQGFEATPVSDLVEATGLSRASLYLAFTDKAGLYKASLDRYRENQRSYLAKLRGQSPDALSALRELFHSAVAPHRRMGCLVVNTAIEMAPSDDTLRRLVLDSFTTLERTILALLEEAQQEGLLKREMDLGAAARRMMTEFTGLRILSRAGLPPAQLRSLAAACLSSVEE